MKIYIGADHRGYELKGKITADLKGKGYEVVDMGTHEEGIACDYPKIAYSLASKIVKDKNARGILICMTGLGHCIVANKVPGAYAALCYNKTAAMFARQHNNSNILILGAMFVTAAEITDIIHTWLTTEFETGGRHERRVKQIREIEQRILKKAK